MTEEVQGKTISVTDVIEVRVKTTEAEFLQSLDAALADLRQRMINEFKEEQNAKV